MRINADLTSFTVQQISESWSSNAISVNLEYQRAAVWSLTQQKVLIDSVLRGYPLPRFYFHRKTVRDLMGGEANSFEIIDGQQRTRALAAYHADQWVLLDPAEADVSPYRRVCDDNRPPGRIAHFHSCHLMSSSGSCPRPCPWS